MAILLVDDEPRLRQTLARSLTARGHQVVEAATHQSALAAARSHRFDLLLLDINLPDATGWDVLRDLAATGQSLPTVILSAVPPNQRRISEFKPIGVLLKPFPIDALLHLVRLAAGRDAGAGHARSGP